MSPVPTALVLSLVLSGAAAGQPAPPAKTPQQAAHDDHGARPDPARIHRYDRQQVALDRLAGIGYVLDIGGGGEGIIGQLEPERVVAIDVNARELLGAPPGPLKIVMDATDLKFLDATFRTATSFFTLMYMKPEDQVKAAGEVFRVLEPGGRFLVWDVLLPARFDPVKDIAVVPLTITLPGREVQTGYGTFFPGKPHDLPYFVSLATTAGFEVAAQRSQGLTFFLELRKPDGTPPGGR
jgi:SAM-dependent methyltransferase